MIDQKLIDWVKNQQSQGYSVEQIRGYLIQYGYSQEAVEQALSIASQEDSHLVVQTGKIKKIVLLTTIGLIAAASLSAGAFFIFKLAQEDAVVEDEGELINEELVAEAPEREFQPEQEEAGRTEEEFVRCNSMDCIIALAQTCRVGELYDPDLSLPLPFAGEYYRVKGSQYFRIDGTDGEGNCVLVQEPRAGGVVVLTEQGQQLAEQEGLSQEEIDTELQQLTASINDSQALAVRTTCRGASADIATYLANTAEGSGEVSCSSRLGEEETHCTYEPNLTCVIRTTE